MANESVTTISEKLENLPINGEKPNDSNKEIAENDVTDHNLPLEDIYKLALSFYKEKEGKAVHFSYEDKTLLVAFSQQVTHGPYAQVYHKLPVLGALDVVGRDRRLAWQKLGNLTQDQARSGFIELLGRKCPLFSTYIEAHRREKQERDRRSREDEKRKQADEQEKLKKAEELRILEQQKEKDEAIKRQIQQALNAQTFEQFKKYAEQQFPGDPEKQGALIRQLQDQHYIQYMQQLQSIDKTVQENEELEESPKIEEFEANFTLEHPIEPASMWTRQDVEQFKQAVSKADGDGVVRVGHGETVTVRVPTNGSANRIFWEFATDHYDIGFGVLFEFGTPSTTQVSVHVSDSDDEDPDDADDESSDDKDPEIGPEQPKTAVTEIVPVYRRDCHNEVYAGSHQYPGPGVYLLKFDNSYSVWRSKTLYYRVYYTQ